MTSAPTGALTGRGAGTAPVGGGRHSPQSPGAVQTVSDELPDRREPAELVRDAVLAVAGVAGLHGGPYGTVATYLPGRRVFGVAVHEGGSTEVSFVARMPRGLRTDLQTLAARVSATTAALIPGPVHVTVADLATDA